MPKTVARFVFLGLLAIAFVGCERSVFYSHIAQRASGGNGQGYDILNEAPCRSKQSETRISENDTRATGTVTFTRQVLSGPAVYPVAFGFQGAQRTYTSTD